MAAAAAAQQGAAEAATSASKGTANEEEEEDEMPELEAAEEDAPVDEGDLDPKEIEMVIAQVRVVLFIVAALYLLVVFQTGCTRAIAVRALKESNGDLINASMCLSVLLHRYYTDMLSL